MTKKNCSKYLKISRSNIKKAKQDGLPLVYGKIRYATAVAWLEARAVEEAREAQPQAHYSGCVPKTKPAVNLVNGCVGMVD